MARSRSNRCAWLLVLLLLAPLTVAAEQSSPEALVKNVTEEVLSTLRENKDSEDGLSRNEAIAVIETKIAPHFDFQRMTALAVGRGWREADAGQREALTEAFRSLLVRTYANALANYEDQTVAFQGAQYPEDAKEATVRSQIKQPGGTPISIDYRLARTAQGWKVYDVAIDHVSLVTSYRGSFATELSKGGVEGLLQALQSKVRGFDGAAAS